MTIESNFKKPIQSSLLHPTAEIASFQISVLCLHFTTLLILLHKYLMTITISWKLITTISSSDREFINLGRYRINYSVILFIFCNETHQRFIKMWCGPPHGR